MSPSSPAARVVQKKNMKYLSTRGNSPAADFRDVVLEGLAPDRGLYIPERIPDVASELAAWTAHSYSELAFEIMRRFCDLPADALRDLIARAYSTFDHPDIAPVKRVGDRWILELFHGPTLAFKDLALQFLGRLFNTLLEETGEQLNILVATSGDTGSAAIHGVRGCPNIRIFVMHPRGRISPLQERQMTSVLDPNVFNLAIEGSFDDCQRILKTLLGDLELKRALRLGAMNSVNWARVLAQIVYYFSSALHVMRATGADRVRFAVPTGNFGDVFAGYMAARMGLPIERLVLATNANDILARFFNTGEYRLGRVIPTLSPSMDIQVASNFERYLFYRLGENPARVREALEAFDREGRWMSPDHAHDPLWAAGHADDDRTCAVIREIWERHGYLLDPHTAVGVAVAQRLDSSDAPLICLATAHPAKFPEAIARAIGRDDLARHERLDALRDAPTRSERLPADVRRVRDYLERHIRP